MQRWTSQQIERNTHNYFTNLLKNKDWHKDLDAFIENEGDEGEEVDITDVTSKIMKMIIDNIIAGPHEFRDEKEDTIADLVLLMAEEYQTFIKSSDIDIDEYEKKLDELGLELLSGAVRQSVEQMDLKIYESQEELKKKREEFKKKQGELQKTEKKRSKKLAKQKKIKNQCRDLIMQDDNNNDEWIKEDDRNFILKVGKSHICHNTDSIQKVINKNYFYECLKINNDIRGAYEPGEDFNNKIKYFKLYPNNELIKYDGDFFNKPLKTKHYILKKTGKKLIGIISSKLAPTVTESFIGKDHCQSGSSQIVYKIVPEKVKKKQIGGNKKSIVTLGGIVLSIILLLFK